MKLAGLLAVSAILGASVFAATASASHIQCGDTITVANDNGINGINAPLGTIDGGGNVASGNGGQDCVNVSCTSG